jgi:hypothetical protein
MRSIVHSGVVVLGLFLVGCEGPAIVDSPSARFDLGGELGRASSDLAAVERDDLSLLPRAGDLATDDLTAAARVDELDLATRSDDLAWRAGDLALGDQAIASDSSTPLDAGDLAVKIVDVGSWIYENGGDDLSTVWGSGANDVWAVGQLGTIRHYDGTQWTFFSSGTRADLTRVWGTSAEDAWVVGAGGTILHWDGTAWSAFSSPTRNDLNGVWASATNDAWAAGSNGALLHWDGASWSIVGSPTNENLHRLWGSAADDLWLVGDSASYHWNGAGWSSAGPGGVEVSGTGPNDVWIASSAKIYHWDGTGWAATQYPAGPGFRFFNRSVFALQPGDLRVEFKVWITTSAFVVANGCSEFDGSRWNGITGGAWGGGNGLWGTVGDRVWQVGAAGTIGSCGNPSRDPYQYFFSGHRGWAFGYVHFSNSPVLYRRSGERWLSYPGNPGCHIFTAWGSADDDIWGIGNSSICHYDGQSWSLVVSNYDVEFASWGSAANDIWAVGTSRMHFDGTSWTNLGELSPERTSIWGSAANDVWAAGLQGALEHFDGNSWTTISSGTTQDLTVAGSSSTDVWAVGGGGVILHWDGASWSSVPTGITAYLSKLWVNASNDVWAIGDEKTLFHFDGTSWSQVAPFTRHALYGLWGDGARLWVGGDVGTILRHDP